MIVAIVGDIIGSVHEFTFDKPEYDFFLFSDDSHYTDDTVLSIAFADSILKNVDYKVKLSEYYNLYPYCSYGGTFHQWGKGLMMVLTTAMD